MGPRTQILILENSEPDAELMKRELRKAGFDFKAECVHDKDAFLQTLGHFTPDIILAVYSLPGFDGLAALALAREKIPEVPFIIVSGTIGEEFAVETLKAGATDYVLKQRLFRLGPVVRRALREAEQRAERRRAEEDLRRAKDELETRVRERTEELAKSQERLQQLSSRLLRAQEAERKRVAVELHDGLLSELAAMKFMVEGRLAFLEQGKPWDLDEFKKISAILTAVMKEARGIMNNLHPSILDDLGLIVTLNWLAGEYEKAHPHMRVQTRIEVSERDIADSLKPVIFRVLQEALNNFAKHGKGDLVDLAITKDGNALALLIRDNGQGFDVGNAREGLGLESMRERVTLSGGEFQIESAPGRGTAIRAVWSGP